MANKKTENNARYLQEALALFQKSEKLAITHKSTRFNDTEMRLLGEIIAEKDKGGRLISTKLADRLGITRSAVSQIVNRLESQGVVKRVPDAVDRKIAYIEITGETMDAYTKILKDCRAFVGEVVDRFGAERFENMCADLNEFFALLEEVKGAKSPKGKK